MTFLEAALELLKKHRKPIHFKKLAELAIKHDLLDHVGRTPEVAMQTALANAIRKGQPDLLIRVQPGTFGLRYYPASPAETAKESGKEKEAAATEKAGSEGEGREGGRRRGSVGEPSGAETRAKSAISDEAAGQAAGSGEEGGRRRRRRRRGRGKGVAEATLPGLGEGEGDGGEQASLNLGAGERTPGLQEERRSGDVAELAEAMAPPDDDADENQAAVATGGRSAQPGAREGGFADTSQVAARANLPNDMGEWAARTAGPSVEGRTQPAGKHGGGGPRPGSGYERRSGGHPQGQGQGGNNGASQPAQRGHQGQGPGQPRQDRDRPQPTGSPAADGGAGSLVEAACQILSAQGDRPLHVRQIIDMAAKRRLIRPDGTDQWRALRVALQQDIRERLVRGLRPRVRFLGGAQFALAERGLEAELLGRERGFADAASALRRETRSAIERRLAKLPPVAFEAALQLLLGRLGFVKQDPIKRTAEALYVAAGRPRTTGTPRTLVSLRAGAEQGRRAVGELRAGVVAKGYTDGLLVAAGRLLDDARQEAAAAGPTVELWDGRTVAELMLEQGVGCVRASAPIEYIDTEFFADLVES